MYKIGDFSKLSQVSIKALRLYDQMGLLKPIEVDSFTGYRFYSASQLPRLNRILAFKGLGFSLEQISQLLDEQISSEQIRGMLRLKLAELSQIIEEEKTKLIRVEARIKQIEQEKIMSTYEVVLKKLEPMNVASIRGILPNYYAVGKFFEELYQYLGLSQSQVQSAYCAAIWHDPEYKESDVDGEAMISLEKLVPSSDRIKVYELQGYDSAACI
jgi:DNA-binding transcriptional MerR regulator